MDVGSGALPPLLQLRNVIQQRRMSLVLNGNELPVRVCVAFTTLISRRFSNIL